MNANGYKYKMRGLPCRDAAGNEMSWYVCGREDYTTAEGVRITGGGVLEWCHDREDAILTMKMMTLDSRFSNLSVEKK